MKKILLLLGVCVFLSGCSLVSNGQNVELSALARQNQALQQQITQLQSDYNSLQQASNQASADNQGVTNISCKSLSEYKKFSEVYPDFKLDAVAADLKANLEKGEIYEVCETFYGNRVFLMYGDFGKENNIVGLLKKNNDTEDYTLVTDKQYNLGLGDIGICRVNGLIEKYNVIYSCGGGDGPASFDKVYVLNWKTGQSKLIKDCESFEANANCKINLLGLEEYFY